MGSLLRGVLFLALAAIPIYLFSSGGLQIAHWLFAVYCLGYVALKGGSVGREDAPLLLLFLLLLLREGIGLLGGNPVGSMVPVAHVLFCMVIFNVLRKSLVLERTLAWAERGIFVSALVAVAGVFFIGYGSALDSEGQRAIGTFNNPNQLGYFAVCLASIAALLRLGGLASFTAFMTLLGCAVFLATASLSKAAIIAVAFTAVFGGFAFSRNKRIFFVGFIVAVAVLGSLAVAYSAGMLDDMSWVRRLQGIGTQDDDSLAERGYIAWYRYGALTFLFGMGTTNVYDVVGHEVHSTIAYFFVTYGVLGGALFLVFLAMWAARLYRTFGMKGIVLIVFPAMLYGVTHNGSRFTIFWVLIAMTFAVAARHRARAMASIDPGANLGVTGNRARRAPSAGAWDGS